MTAYSMYRNTSLGQTLQKTLDEYIEDGQIAPSLALKVLVAFDRHMNNALAVRCKNKVSFKAKHLKTYRFCDNVWTFMLEDVEFREGSETIPADRVKIVACDCKGGVGAQALAQQQQTG